MIPDRNFERPAGGNQADGRAASACLKRKAGNNARIASLGRFYTPAMLVTLLVLFVCMSIGTIMATVFSAVFVLSILSDQEHRWLVMITGLAVLWTAWKWKKISS